MIMVNINNREEHIALPENKGDMWPLYAVSKKKFLWFWYYLPSTN